VVYFLWKWHVEMRRGTVIPAPSRS
jgi:hypothetical protein